jgi:2-dehydro-3-deoxyphosphooctonate aldolase (KDO 8-P synthase)
VAVGVAGLALTTRPDAVQAARGPASATAHHAVPLAQLPDLAEGLLRLADGAALAAAPAQAPLFAWHRRQPLPVTDPVD